MQTEIIFFGVVIVGVIVLREYLAKQKVTKYVEMWKQDSENTLKIYKEILTKIANKVDADPEKFVERFNQTKDDFENFVDLNAPMWLIKLSREDQTLREHSKFIESNPELDKYFWVSTSLRQVQGQRFALKNIYFTDDVLEWFLNNDFEEEDFLEWGKGEYFSNHAIVALRVGSVPIHYINEVVNKEYWIGMKNPMSLYVVYGTHDDMKTKETKSTGTLTLTWYGKRDNRKVVWIRAVFKGPLDGSADEYTLDSFTKNPVD